MIPKKIHYCWFGGNPLPLLAQKCIESWKKYLPDYEIIEWNEANYDVHKIPYISQAYKAKKYAFVSDYARVDILNEHGGVYFDTDVEVLKDLSPILAKGPFLGIEAAGAIANGLGMAAEQGDADAQYQLYHHTAKHGGSVGCHGNQRAHGHDNNGKGGKNAAQCHIFCRRALTLHFSSAGRT